jgi:hypothetical protein
MITKYNDFLLEKKNDDKPYDDVKGKVERSKKIPKEMKDKIIPLIVKNGIHGSRYIDGRVIDLQIPKVNGLKFSGVGLGADKDGFYVRTHRAASSRYESPDKIPQSKIDFIKSTG